MALTPQQLTDRLTRIGGSDAGAICGKDPYRDPWQVAMRITGQLPPDETLAEQDVIMIGNEMEAVLANIYEKKNKATLYTPDTIRHPKYPDIIAVNIDRRVKDDPTTAIECKNNGLYVNEVNDDGSPAWGKPGTDQVPARVLLQCSHAMMVVPEIKLFKVLRCFAGNQYQQFVLPRNESLIEALLSIELAFMARVKSGDIPEPDWHLRTTEPALKRMFTQIKGTIEAKPELEHWTLCWEEAAAKKKEAETLEKAIKNRVAHLMGNTEIGTLANGKKWKRKLVKKGAYFVEATQYIELRLVKPKKKPGEAKPAVEDEPEDAE